MNYEHVTLTFKTYWYFKDQPHLKVTRCKKVINTKTNKMLTYGVRGFNIGGKYYKRHQLNKMLVKIEKINMPF